MVMTMIMINMTSMLLMPLTIMKMMATIINDEVDGDYDDNDDNDDDNDADVFDVIDDNDYRTNTSPKKCIMNLEFRLKKKH